MAGFQHLKRDLRLTRDDKSILGLEDGFQAGTVCSSGERWDFRDTSLQEH